ncbi:MAG: hypothetical protein U0736_07175 [Gemmataceae bacterium]
MSVTYPVADLVVPLPDGGRQDRRKTVEKQLIKIIQAHVAPESWAGRGGVGTIDYYPVGMALLVRRTPAVHEQIHELLAALRRLQDVQVTVEMRIVSLPTDLLQQLGFMAGEQLTQPGTIVLDDTQLTMLLQAVQGDRRTNIPAAPKMTMFNGQRATLELTEQQSYVTGVTWEQRDDKKVPHPQVRPVCTGMRLSVLPLVAADGRTVKLQMAVELQRAADGQPAVRDVEPVGEVTVPAPPRGREWAVETTVKLTDGATAALTGWTRHREVRREIAPPILSRIPYLSRLFVNVGIGRESEQVLVLVTPRVIVRQETTEPAAENAAPAPSAEEGEAAPAEQPVEKPVPNPPGPPEKEGAAPAEPPTFHIGKREFELTYEIANVGPCGVRAVQLWWTRDGGAWKRYPDEIRPTGKLPVIAREPGRYGFRLTPHDFACAATRAPADDQPPQVWVVVDTTPPTVAVDPPHVDGDHVVFAWTSTDDHLADRPVRLVWGSTADGPWHAIAADLPAAGQYAAAARDLPPQFYLRAEAVDRAGNHAAATLPEPVTLDGRVPVIRGVGVRAGN